MNNKIKLNEDYKLFKRKMYFRIVLIAVIALGTVIIMRLAASNNMGNWIVWSLEYWYSMPYHRAHNVYWQLIRPNLEIMMFVAVAVFFIILSRTLLSQFAKYFHEISKGLDTLTGDNDGEIKLSPEMASMEKKLKTIKKTLASREKEAKEAEQRKNELVMYLAHDIKTPLTSVIGYLSLLGEAPEMPIEQKAKYVDITLDKAHRLESLIDEFFEVTRYNFQPGRLIKESIDIYYLLAQMVEEFYPALSAYGKKIELCVPEDLTLCGDPVKLARVFNNILKNAVSYSAEGSVIKIAAEASGEMVSIKFINPGSIPEDKLTAVFNKFYRLDSARSTETGGSGLGLAIAKEIVDEHGGRIYAESDGVNTVFTVELPALLI